MLKRLEHLLERQVELVAKLQDKTQEVLGWNTSPELAEATAEYFQALESATESLETLSDLCEYFENVNLEGNGES